jgi:outer membrane protein
MKKLIASMLMLVGVLTSSQLLAQKYAYIDSKYILENISEYKAAQQQLDQLSVAWQKDIESKYAIIDKLYQDYQAEQILLTEDMKRKRETEITNKEKEVKEFQKQKFGYEGELFKKKQSVELWIQKLHPREILGLIHEKIKNSLCSAFAQPFCSSSPFSFLSLPASCPFKADS